MVLMFESPNRSLWRVLFISNLYHKPPGIEVAFPHNVASPGLPQGLRSHIFAFSQGKIEKGRAALKIPGFPGWQTKPKHMCFLAFLHPNQGPAGRWPKLGVIVGPQKENPEEYRSMFFEGFFFSGGFGKIVMQQYAW